MGERPKREGVYVYTELIHFIVHQETTQYHKATMCVCVLLTQSCPALCNPMDCNPPGSSVHGIFQARTLEWVAISLLHGIFLIQGSNPRIPYLLHWQAVSLPLSPLGISDQIRSDQSISRVRLFETAWTVAYQAPLFMGFSRQEHWKGLLFHIPGDFPNPGIEPRSPPL